MSELNDMSLVQLLETGIRRDTEAKLAKAEADDIKAEIRRRYPDAVELGEGRVTAKVTYPRRFDESRARKVLTETELDQISVSKLDGALAMKKFGEEQYALLSRPDTPRVQFKLEE